MANLIKKTLFTKKKNNNNNDISNNNDVELNKIPLNNIEQLKKLFDDSLVVIDEVQNIRSIDSNTKKKISVYIQLLVRYTSTMRLLLLSATPMYNSHKEIIWLVNLLNMNDNRSILNPNDVFDSTGAFKNNVNDVDKSGKDLLIRKSTGYISFVRGDNPYTFPYRIYPNIFAPQKSIFSYDGGYPRQQMNLKPIDDSDKTRIIDIYLSTIGNCGNCGDCQSCLYKYIIFILRNKNFNKVTNRGDVIEMPDFEEMDSFGYTTLQLPIESLIISYPHLQSQTLIKNVLEKMNKRDNNFDDNFNDDDTDTDEM